jgi:hypothetical protein
LRHRLEPRFEVVEGEADPKPYKVDRLKIDGDFSAREAEYATEAEAIAHVKRRLDRRYRIVKGRVQVWSPPSR